jgi:hypothetical protein
MNGYIGDSHGPPCRSRFRRAYVLAAVLAGVALLATACGGGGSSSAAGPAAAGSTNYQKELAFAQCMRSHGLPGWPDPDSQGNFNAAPIDARSSQYQSASKACRHLLPNGGQETAAELKADLGQALKLAACMRAHGIVNFPDPHAVPDGVIQSTGGIDSSSPQFQAASRACNGPWSQGGGS